MPFVLKSLLQVCHSIQDSTIEFVYLATEESPDIKTQHIIRIDSKFVAGLSDETFAWIAHSYVVNVSNSDKFTSDSKGLIDKVHEGNKV